MGNLISTFTICLKNKTYKYNVTKLFYQRNSNNNNRKIISDQ